MENKEDLIKQRKIPTWGKICYGLGDFAQNGTFQFIAYYLLFFYTDEVRCSLALINVILIFGRIMDALVTPFVGIIVDRTHTRMGRCRPWVLTGCIFLNISLPLLFFVPDANKEGIGIWLIAIYSVFSISYAVANVPYSVMMSVMTDDESERYSLNMYKNIGANLGGVFVSVCTVFLVLWFTANGAPGYLSAAMVYAVFFFACSVLCVSFTREQQADRENRKQKVTAGMMIRAFRNRPWVILLCMEFLACIANMLHIQSMIYYAKYCIGSENVSTWFMMMGPASAFLAAFYLPKLARHIGMKKCVLSGILISSVGLLGIRAVGTHMGLAVIMQLLYSVGWANTTGLIFVIITATIDYHERITGERPQGFMVSFMTFMMKCGCLIGVMLGTMLLDRADYHAGMEMSGAVLLAIHMEFIWIPLMVSGLILFLLLFFKIDNL